MTWTVVSEKFDAEMTAFKDLGEKKALIMAQTRKWILTVVSDLSM